MAQIGYGFYAGVPDWAKPYLADGWHLIHGPGATNPIPHNRVIGRPATPGDGWEMEFVRRRYDGGRAFGAYCLPQWQKAPAVDWWLGPCEPAADSAQDAEDLSAFYRGFAGFAHDHGRKIIGGSFSRGRPDENTLAGYVEMARACDGLAFHEYGLRDMRDPADLSWHCFRFPRLMEVLAAHGIQRPVWITELGLDLGTGDGGRDGWIGRASAQDFLAQLEWYAARARNYPYVRGLILFHGSSYSFPSFLCNADIMAGCQAINRRLAATPAPVPLPTPWPGPTAFSQRDPRWQAEPLGNGGGKTLGEAGCLVSAMASGLVDLGLGWRTPSELNAWLKTHGGFARGNLFVWAAVKALGAELVSRVNCRWTLAPVSAMRDALAAGQIVIAQVDARPGGEVDQHWVRILSVDADGRDATIMDPWQTPGQEKIRLSSRYVAKGWNVARAVFAVAIYQRAA